MFDVERTFIYGRARNATIQRIQFPLVPAAGRFVHRAQGSTLDKAVIDLTQKQNQKSPTSTLCCPKQDIVKESPHNQL